jgi:hypothetical protein
MANPVVGRPARLPWHGAIPGNRAGSPYNPEDRAIIQPTARHPEAQQCRRGLEEPQDLLALGRFLRCGLGG